MTNRLGLVHSQIWIRTQDFLVAKKQCFVNHVEKVFGLLIFFSQFIQVVEYILPPRYG